MASLEMRERIARAIYSSAPDRMPWEQAIESDVVAVYCAVGNARSAADAVLAEIGPFVTLAQLDEAATGDRAEVVMDLIGCHPSAPAASDAQSLLAVARVIEEARRVG